MRTAGPSAFVDPEGCRQYLDDAEAALRTNLGN